jgi:hypothetical protein
MSRTYERDGKHYDFALLTHLVEIGEATFFEGPSIFVIKTEDGTVAVRPHQVFFRPTPAPFTVVVPDEDEADGEPEVVAEVEVARGPGGLSAADRDDLLSHFR